MSEMEKIGNEMCLRTGGETGMRCMEADRGAGLETVNGTVLGRETVIEIGRETIVETETEIGRETTVETGIEIGRENTVGTGNGIAAGKGTERETVAGRETAVEVEILIDIEKVMGTRGEIGTAIEIVSGRENLTGKTMTETEEKTEKGIETVSEIETVGTKDENAQGAVNGTVGEREKDEIGTETGTERGRRTGKKTGTRKGDGGAEAKIEKRRKETDLRPQGTQKNLLIMKLCPNFSFLQYSRHSSKLTSFGTWIFFLTRFACMSYYSTWVM